MKVFDNIALAAAQIMIPVEGTDLKKWAVIACDQYTSEPDYWKKVEENVGDSPSALRLILPEVYLGTENEQQISERLRNISGTAEEYIKNGVWKTLGEGVILVDRKTDLHPSRKGLVAAVDLEQYSFEPGNKEKIRATEGTVLSRIPPRVRIRANSPVELPHVMLLIDDPEDTVIGHAIDSLKEKNSKPIYDTDLFGKSGHVTGYFVNAQTDVFDKVTNALAELLDRSEDGMLFAVGDGNHSLASAKAHWDNIKDDLDIKERGDHPARFALVEIVNIHDAGLDFEPIHRVVFEKDRDELLSEALEFFKDNKASVGSEKISSAQNIVFVSDKGEDKVLRIEEAPHTLAVGSIQMFLDKIGAEVDYIHGEDSVRSLSKGNVTGILLPEVRKDSFFETIAREGVFPRKTFSMGEAFEKRFYLEAKMIR
ncbi:MAG: DUF1015 domain-containing protein [Clostridiales bacterium]|nr:DUF1015 domain-containing protein [Clostridiales bacterium]